MNDDLKSVEIKRQRAQAVKTAWLLGIIALAIFGFFIGSAVIGH